MAPITKTCCASGIPFVITDEDQAFYAKMGVPLPTLSPIERIRRRLTFRNERKLYHRKCDLCAKEIIAMYPANSPYTVYCQACFWSDKWDPTAFGKDVDFNRPFFDQFAELMLKVPRISLMNKDHENAEYGNFTLRNKNSYLLVTCAECEDSFYTKRSWFCKNTCDGSNLTRCELSYESIDCANCYNSSWLQDSSDCYDCILGYNLTSCHNCFGCYNLVNKNFCIYNVEYSKEEYLNKFVELHKNLPSEVEKFLAKTDIPRKYMAEINNQDCSGDAVYNSKNAHYCFDTTRLEDCKFVIDATNIKDSYDMNNGDNSELIYDSIGVEGDYMTRFIDICWFNKYITYSSMCFNSEYLFGCIGAKRNKFMILNKVYKEEEYKQMEAKLIEHMQKTGEWGEFFPMSLSPFAYNETVAQDHYPFSKEQAEKLGLKWKEDTDEFAYQGQKISPPLWAKDVNEDICKTIYTCKASGKFYKITPQELALYKKMDLPLPQKAPEQRFKERMMLKNPRMIWLRPCSTCGKQLETAYDPSKPGQILCEECYLKTVY
ncbi:MAG: hypothetical protein WC897_04425 [Candidatus Gracilibacteria bacterium]